MTASLARILADPEATASPSSAPALKLGHRHERGVGRVLGSAERVAAPLGLWSTRHGIRVSFESRDVQAGGAIIPSICVCFHAKA